jgi:heterodisulfide reductase subunit C/quinone-modifying oxidoreductase subunit QmoC
VDNVESYGRSFEFGLATRHYLKHFPLRLPGMAPMGFGMLSRKRMEITPRRIEGIDQLKAILARAKELELAE